MSLICLDHFMFLTFIDCPHHRLHAWEHTGPLRAYTCILPVHVQTMQTHITCVSIRRLGLRILSASEGGREDGREGGRENGQEMSGGLRVKCSFFVTSAVTPAGICCALVTVSVAGAADRPHPRCCRLLMGTAGCKCSRCRCLHPFKGLYSALKWFYRVCIF